MSGLYDEDVAVWSEQQAQLLRRIAAGEAVNETPDWQNIAEEIEALGKSQGRELANRIGIILEHLIKLEASPANDPRPGWRGTIRRQRNALDLLLRDAPSLRSTVPAVIADQIGRARRDALEALADNSEKPRTDVLNATYTEDQLLGDWMPAWPQDVP